MKKLKKLRRRLRELLCKKMGWHKPGVVYGNMNDPLQQMYSTCRYCGFHGMLDSQGNLF